MRPGCLVLLPALLAVPACAPPAVSPSSAAAAAASAPVSEPPEVGAWARILLPGGDCATGWLELQRFDPETQRWEPHPEHPRIRAGSCLRERSDRLLTDLRLRCIDPSGRRAPSEWVQGVQVDRALGPDACAGSPPEDAPAER